MGLAVAETVFNSDVVTRETPAQDLALVEQYKEVYGIDSIPYEAIAVDIPKDLTLSSRLNEGDIKGVEINKEKFAINLIACDEETRSCVFRINGLSTGPLYEKAGLDAPNAIAVGNTHLLKVNKIIFNFCDNRRYCSSHFQAYDVADVTVTPVSAGDVIDGQIAE